MLFVSFVVSNIFNHQGTDHAPIFLQKNQKAPPGNPALFTASGCDVCGNQFHHDEDPPAAGAFLFFGWNTLSLGGGGLADCGG